MIVPVEKYILWSAAITSGLVGYQEIACTMANKDGEILCGDMFIGGLLPETCNMEEGK